LSTEEHLLPNEIIKYTSPKPVHLEKDSMKFSLHITNIRLVLHGKERSIEEKLSDIDYFVYREKKGIFPKCYIRFWTGTKKVDLIGDRDTMKQIYSELQKHLKLKPKKGGAIIVLGEDEFPIRQLEVFCKKKNVELKQVLHSGGGFVLLVPEDSFDYASEDLVRMLEDEWNWNLECLPNGKFKITIIPELPTQKTVYKVDRPELADYSQLIINSERKRIPSVDHAWLEALYMEAKIIDIFVDGQIV